MSNKWYKTKVVRGQGKGRELGFPTANLEVPKDFEFKYGIYTTTVSPSAKDVLKGILYWGTKGGQNESLEIHIFDFEGDLYGEILQFQVGGFIREDRTFDSVEELVRQMHVDVAQTRKVG